MACLDLTLLDSFEDRVNQCLRCLGEWYFTDDECLGVELLNLGTYLQHATPLSVVVFGHIDGASCGEVGEELERFLMQITDGSITYLHEVMGQDLGRQAYGNTLRTLCQQQGEFHRQGDRFLVPAVIRHLPFGGLGIKNGVKGEFRQSCLDISGCRRLVTCQDITPVPLGVYQ